MSTAADSSAFCFRFRSRVAPELAPHASSLALRRCGAHRSAASLLPRSVTNRLSITGRFATELRSQLVLPAAAILLSARSADVACECRVDTDECLARANHAMLESERRIRAMSEAGLSMSDLSARSRGVIAEARRTIAANPYSRTSNDDGISGAVLIVLSSAATSVP